MTSLNESHYRLSKKVAQLTKVVVHLNTVNENVELEKQKLCDEHDQEIRSVREESDGKLTLLQKEIETKDKALRELNDRLISSEKEAQQRLVDAEQEAEQRLVAAQSEANARKVELQTIHKDEIKALTERHAKELSEKIEIARDLSLKLEDAPKKHRSETSSVKELLKKEHQLALKRQREELTNSHTDELHRLKSQHEKTVAQLKVDATEHEKLEIDSAVTLIKAEYEQKIYQQIIQHNEKCHAIKAETTTRLNKEILHLQEELNEARAVAQEVPNLRVKIHEHSDNEKKLSSEVRRLQDSLDASNASNRHIIDNLKRDNGELQSEVREVSRALEQCTQRADNVEKEVRLFGTFI
jgi:hypothetical protein